MAPDRREFLKATTAMSAASMVPIIGDCRQYPNLLIDEGSGDVQDNPPQKIEEPETYKFKTNPLDIIQHHVHKVQDINTKIQNARYRSIPRLILNTKFINKEEWPSCSIDPKHLYWVFSNIASDQSASGAFIRRGTEAFVPLGNASEFNYQENILSITNRRGDYGRLENMFLRHILKNENKVFLDGARKCTRETRNIIGDYLHWGSDTNHENEKKFFELLEKNGIRNKIKSLVVHPSEYGVISQFDKFERTDLKKYLNGNMEIGNIVFGQINDEEGDGNKIDVYMSHIASKHIMIGIGRDAGSIFYNVPPTLLPQSNLEVIGHHYFGMIIKADDIVVIDV